MGNPTKDLISPWHPMNDPKDLKVIGKFLEELGEGVSAGARSLIQGIDESEPLSGKVNREWLTEEIADMLGNADIVIDHFGLDRDAIAVRSERKKANLRRWHEGA